MPEGPDAAVLKACRCISARGVQTAVRMVLPRELARQAASQAGRMASRAGLQFDVEGVAALAATAHKAALLTEGGAVYLTAVLQYLCAELLELSGDAARADGQAMIGPRHVMLAIRNDEELRELCAHAVIREAGVPPAPEAAGAQELRDHPFDTVFADMLRSAPGGVLVDPRDGCHKCLKEESAGSHSTVQALPALDAACACGPLARRSEAVEALTDRQREARLARNNTFSRLALCGTRS